MQIRCFSICILTSDRCDFSGAIVGKFSGWKAAVTLIESRSDWSESEDDRYKKRLQIFSRWICMRPKVHRLFFHSPQIVGGASRRSATSTNGAHSYSRSILSTHNSYFACKLFPTRIDMQISTALRRLCHLPLHESPKWKYRRSAERMRSRTPPRCTPQGPNRSLELRERPTNNETFFSKT